MYTGKHDHELNPGVDECVVKVLETPVIDKLSPLTLQRMLHDTAAKLHVNSTRRADASASHMTRLLTQLGASIC